LMLKIFVIYKWVVTGALTWTYWIFLLQKECFPWNCVLNGNEFYTRSEDFTTKVNKISGSQLCHLVRSDSHFESHVCLHHQDLMWHWTETVLSVYQLVVCDWNWVQVNRRELSLNPSLNKCSLMYVTFLKTVLVSVWPQ
jgi:hypothetical protein